MSRDGRGPRSFCRSSGAPILNLGQRTAPGRSSFPRIARHAATPIGLTAIPINLMPSIYERDDDLMLLYGVAAENEGWPTRAPGGQTGRRSAE